VLSQAENKNFELLMAVKTMPDAVFDDECDTKSVSKLQQLKEKSQEIEHLKQEKRVLAAKLRSNSDRASKCTARKIQLEECMRVPPVTDHVTATWVQALECTPFLRLLKLRRRAFSIRLPFYAATSRKLNNDSLTQRLNTAICKNID
jgi:hypothetical protein